MRLLLLIAAFLLPGIAHARDVTLKSEVFVERVTTDADGKTVVTLGAPDIVTPGDALVFQLNYRNDGPLPATGLVLTNPIPGSVAFVATEDASAQLSVDGGKTWGVLASLQVAGPDGNARPATVADVTHIRWVLTEPISGGAGGKLSFRAKVK